MKAYGIDINPQMIQYNAAIRQKGDVARLLVNIVRFLNVLGIPPQLDSLTKNWSEDYIRLVLYIEKMSRVFICEREKIHTFQFPFQIIIEEDRCVVLFEGEHILVLRVLYYHPFSKNYRKMKALKQYSKNTGKSFQIWRSACRIIKCAEN